MSTIAEIKAAFEELPENDAREVAAWIQGFMEDRWDRQIGHDIAAGKLDQLADQALARYEAEDVKPLRAFLDNS